MKRSYHIAVGLVLVSGSLNAHPGCAVAPQTVQVTEKKVTTQVVTETVPVQAQPVAASNRIELASANDLDAHLKNNKHVIVVFTATWCGPCNKLKPLLEQVRNENKDVVFVIVDGDKFAGLAGKHAPQGFPTLKFFKDGKETGKVVGGVEDKEDLQSSINQFLKGGVPLFETVEAPAPAAPAPAQSAPVVKAPAAPSVATGNRIELNSAADFDAYLKKGGNILAIFSTTWCGPCKALKPVLEELVSSNKNVTFVFVDGDNHPSLVKRYVGAGFPTLKFFKNGKEVGQSVGGASKSELQSMINSKFA